MSESLTPQLQPEAQELLALIKAEPTAPADKDGLTPLQQRLLKNQSPSTTFDALEKEEKLCAEISAAVLALNEVQVDRFVKYVLQCPFIRSYLNKRYDELYLQGLRSAIPPLNPIVVGLLTVMVFNLGNVKLGDRELLKDPLLTELRTLDPDLWLELLYQSNWTLFRSELIERFESYGYEVLALGRDRWILEEKCDLQELEVMVHELEPKLEDKELKWMTDFIASKRIVGKGEQVAVRTSSNIGKFFGWALSQEPETSKPSLQEYAYATV